MESTPLLTNSNYRGGFSSSINRLFSSSEDQSDCCAFACCGLLLADRNAHFLALRASEDGDTSAARPPSPWWRRLVINIALPTFILLLIGQLADNSDEAEKSRVVVVGMTVFVVVVIFLCLRGWYFRYKQRQQVMREIRRYHDASTFVENNVNLDMERHCCNTLCATSICGCLSNDAIVVQRDSPASSSDLCACLWKTWSALCCGVCCNCWCQCCGMCAIAQEDRELRRILPANVDIDFITFEPFDDYYPKLQELREQRVTSFWQHVSNMSKLSYKLLQVLTWSLVILAIAAVLRVEINFTFFSLLVVLATFFQAFLILYFVHWRWNRFDVSLDAVIKFFSSGFVLCTGLAVVYELVVSLVLELLASFFIILAYSEEEFPDSSREAKDIAREFQKNHFLLYCFFCFLNAFVVAALVEELAKYFGFSMVEHPDLKDTRSSLESRGTSITISMVTTALGFACCENLLYVFVYTPPSIANQVATLVARSIFPVHPLAAAIQSIGVCRRDLEKDESYKLGRILLPAVLLHGSFDFILMLLALIQSSSQVAYDDDFQELNLEDQLPPLISSVVIVMLGLFYYVFKADAQRARLCELDDQRRTLSTDETSPLVV